MMEGTLTLMFSYIYFMRFIYVIQIGEQNKLVLAPSRLWFLFLINVSTKNICISHQIIQLLLLLLISENSYSVKKQISGFSSFCGLLGCRMCSSIV